MRLDNQNILKQKAIDQGFSCQSPIIIDGKPYRLEPKPKARPHVLQRNGFTIEKNEAGELFAQIPNGIHDKDFLAEENGTIYCTLCKGDK